MTLLNDSDISELGLSDIQRENIVNLLININNPNLRLRLNSTFNIDDEKQELTVERLSLSKRGYCYGVNFLRDKISIIPLPRRFD